MNIDRIIQKEENMEAESNYEGAFALCTNALNSDGNNKYLL